MRAAFCGRCVDEVGRAAIGGAVHAAPWCWDPDRIPRGAERFKKVTNARRERLYEQICRVADVSVVPMRLGRGIKRLNIGGRPPCDGARIGGAEIRRRTMRLIEAI